MWDAFQQDVLAALGHTVYVPRTRPEAALPPHEGPATGAHGDLPPALLQALARAAGVPVDALPPLPPPAQLRTPAGKRALWPRLRALRRERR
ncbi:MAG TPA: hypothetical protein VM576_06175 [Xanthomonadaceae bacterium]|nr:hypothetical protein [Xanthomonadaceae bacterium]